MFFNVSDSEVYLGASKKLKYYKKETVNVNVLAESF